MTRSGWRLCAAFLATLSLTPCVAADELRPGQTWLDAPMSQWMEKIVREKATDGNKAVFLNDGSEFFPVRLEMIRSAKRGDTIDLITAIWCDDAAGILVAEELAKAAGRGVRVRAVSDYLNGGDGGPHPVVTSTLRSAGIPFIQFNPPYWGLSDVNNTRVHEKMMIWNGSLALVGGANLCDAYQLGKNVKLWHDFEIYLVGPVVSQLQSAYDENFNWMSDQDYQVREGYEEVLEDPDHVPTIHRSFPHYDKATPTTDWARISPMPGEARVLFEYQRPYRRKKDTKSFIELYGELLNRARSRAVIHTPYAVFPKEFRKYLVKAAKHGIKVQLMTNSRETTDEGDQVVAAAYAHYRELLDAGVEIYEIKTRMLHGKSILIDETVLSVGSHNFDNRSFKDQGESAVLLGDQVAIQKFKAMCDDEVATWHRVTREDVAAHEKGLGNKLKNLWGKIMSGID